MAIMKGKLCRKKGLAAAAAAADKQLTRSRHAAETQLVWMTGASITQPPRDADATRPPCVQCVPGVSPKSFSSNYK